MICLKSVVSHGDGLSSAQETNPVSHMKIIPLPIPFILIGSSMMTHYLHFTAIKVYACHDHLKYKFPLILLYAMLYLQSAERFPLLNER